MNHQWGGRAPSFPLIMEANNTVKGTNGHRCTSVVELDYRRQFCPLTNPGYSESGRIQGVSIGLPSLLCPVRIGPHSSSSQWVFGLQKICSLLWISRKILQSWYTLESSRTACLHCQLCCLYWSHEISYGCILSYALALRDHFWAYSITLNMRTLPFYCRSIPIWATVQQSG